MIYLWSILIYKILNPFQDKVVLSVKAEDGDKGNPREIGYALLADGSPFAPFFWMDPQSGRMVFMRSIASKFYFKMNLSFRSIEG